MRQNKSILMLIGCWIFTVGFVASGSGWGWMIGELLDDRPEWSVCGLDMCACTPIPDAEPDCPLCETGDESSAVSRHAKRAPIMKKMADAGYAADTMVVAAFLVVFAGDKEKQVVLCDQNPAARSDGWSMCSRPDIGVPTPPPRV